MFKKVYWLVFVSVVLLLGVQFVAVDVDDEAQGISLLRDQGSFGNWRWVVDYQAFQFVGMPAYSGMGVKIGVVDFGDEHGFAVRDMVQYALPYASVTLYDIWETVAQHRCLEKPTSALMAACAHRAIYEKILEAVMDGNLYINMSFGFLEPIRSDVQRYLREKGCSKFPYGMFYEEVAELIASHKEVQFVASAGNLNVTGRVGFPSCLDDVWTSIALARQAVYDLESLEIASYSNVIKEGFASPVGGVVIDAYEREYAGTSFSAPVLTALVATICQRQDAVATTAPVHVVYKDLKIPVPRIERGSALCI